MLTSGRYRGAQTKGPPYEGELQGGSLLSTINIQLSTTRTAYLSSVLSISRVVPNRTASSSTAGLEMVSIGIRVSASTTTA